MPTDTVSRRAQQLDTVLTQGAAWFDRLSWPREQIQAHQERLLGRLLAHAQQHSAFHARRLAGVDASTFTLDRLRDLPVMTKPEMMANFDEVVTDRRLTRKVTEAHLAAAGSELAHLHDEYVVMASGGSSGVRGLFVYDDEGFVSFVLTLVRETLHTVRSLGVTADQPLSGAIVAAGSTAHATAAAARLVGVAPSPVRMHPVPATLPFDELLARLEQIQPIFLIAYGSMLPRLAAAKAEGRLNIAPFVVSSTSEPFPTAARASVESAFGVPVGNTFGSTEGLVGIAPAGHHAIRFAEDTCIVECVDDAGEPVGPGEPSAKVFVTNLTNRAQPLIRYELSDRFERVHGDWPDGYLRAVVDGRNDDPLRWGAISVHPLLLRGVLVRYPHVLEHQVRQTERGVDIVVVESGDGAVALDAIAAQIHTALGAAGLSDPAVTVTKVPAIERDPTTGKARRIVALG